ncbi:MAG: Uma2 family endonuclease [Faecalimonas sp.]|nr:Uma2 family endonuclease [Faecalimonas sp.]
MEKDNEIRYSDRDNEANEADMLKEEVAYGVKRQGEYTLEDYYAIPDERRVELIDGVIYDMAAPTYTHQDLVLEIVYWLKDYVKKNKGKCKVYASPIDVQLDCDDKTMVQPDVIVVCDRDKIINRCLYGAPDFVVEVLSPSSAKRDTAIKLRKYKEARVREYWMIDPDKKKVIVYDWTKSEIPKVYGFDSKVPVGIFNGECEIDFVEIYEEIKFLYEKE